jgi:hypothetical protein
MMKLFREAWDLNLLREISNNLQVLRELPLEVNLWTIQNLYCETAREAWPSYLSSSREGDEKARLWTEEFAKVGDLLNISTDDMLKGRQ